MKIYRLNETVVELPCWRCRGEGMADDLECESCLGYGFQNHDVGWMTTLAGNLAVIGALFAAFRAGDNFGFHMGADESQCTCQWTPCSGVPYRKATRCDQEDAADAAYESLRAEWDDFAP